MPSGRLAASGIFPSGRRRSSSVRRICVESPRRRRKACARPCTASLAPAAAARPRGQTRPTASRTPRCRGAHPQVRLPQPSAGLQQRARASRIGLIAGRSPRRSPSRRSRSPSSSAASWVGLEVRDAIGDRRAATSPSTSRLSRGHDLPDHPAMREPPYRGAVDHPQAFRG